MTNTAALVASLRPRIGTVLHNVAHLETDILIVKFTLVMKYPTITQKCPIEQHLIAVVAGVFILAAVPRNVASA